MIERVYMPTYILELNLGGEVVQMKRDEAGRPFLEVTARQKSFLPAFIDDAALLTQEGESSDEGKTGEEGKENGDNGNTQEPGTAGNTPAPVAGTETHTLNSQGAKDFVATIDDAALLTLILEGERTHPQFANGRVGVIAAIENRIKEIQEKG